jgi:Flp pilus assembly protein CpaB
LESPFWSGSSSACAFFLFSHPRHSAQNTAPATDAQPVVATNEMVAFAAKDIPERSIVTADMLELRRLPGADAGSDAYVADQGLVAGYITRRGIPRGTPLRRTDLLGHITDIGIAGAVRPGFRAMAIPILNKATLHDLIKVGDFVDVLAAFDQQESRAIVRSVRVLAVDVFGKDFPQVRVAQRGDYKAEPAGIGTANPGSPPGATGARPGSTVTTTTAGGQSTTTAAPTDAPTPVPGNGQPPPRPEPSLTLEVTPDQATAIQLAQSASAPLDFILLPRPLVAVAPEVRVATTIRPRVAPYAESVKRRGASGGNASGGNASNAARNRDRTGERIGNTYDRFTQRTERRLSTSAGQVPSIPSAGSTGSTQVPPATIAEAPKTYRIPIYGDGKLVREDVVLKPAE